MWRFWFIIIISAVTAISGKENFFICLLICSGILIPCFIFIKLFSRYISDPHHYPTPLCLFREKSVLDENEDDECQDPWDKASKERLEEIRRDVYGKEPENYEEIRRRRVHRY